MYTAEPSGFPVSLTWSDCFSIRPVSTFKARSDVTMPDTGTPVILPANFHSIWALSLSFILMLVTSVVYSSITS